MSCTRARRKIVRQRAVTGDVHAAADALDDEIVNVEHFGKLRGHGFQTMFEFGVADDFFRLFDSRWLTLNVGKDVGNFRDVTADVGFEFGDLIVGAA